MKSGVLHAIVLYIVVVNVVTFIVYGVDKWRARRGKWRVPEHTLLGLAAVGGSIGAWAAMRCFRHKTLHNKFRIGVPVILLVQLAIAVFIATK